jgi:hypothetical protein
MSRKRRIWQFYFKHHSANLKVNLNDCFKDQIIKKQKAESLKKLTPATNNVSI